MKRSNDGIGAGGVATKSTENASLGSDKWDCRVCGDGWGCLLIYKYDYYVTVFDS
jgi:hypothetical protein